MTPESFISSLPLLFRAFISSSSPVTCFFLVLSLSLSPFLSSFLLPRLSSSPPPSLSLSTFLPSVFPSLLALFPLRPLLHLSSSLFPLSFCPSSQSPTLKYSEPLKRWTELKLLDHEYFPRMEVSPSLSNSDTDKLNDEISVRLWRLTFISFICYIFIFLFMN